MTNEMNIIVQELVRRANEDSRRLRILEQRMDMNESKLSTLEDTSNKKFSNTKKKLEELKKEILTINERLEKTETAIKRIEDKLSKTARKADIKEFEKMIEILSPLNQEYVTRKEFEELKNKVEELSGD